MQTLELPNFDALNIRGKSRLVADAAADQPVAALENPQGFIVQEYAILGEPGAEDAELILIDGVDEDQITAAENLARDHSRGEAITLLSGNMIRIYRASNVNGYEPDDDADYSLLDTIEIDVDQMSTEYTDETGGSDYWYKKTYYNETTGLETALEDSDAVRGGNYGHYVTLDEVVDEAFPAGNDYVRASLVADARDDAEDEVNGTIASRYTLPLTSTPRMLKRATKLIAAGWLLTKVWSTGEEGTNKDGNDRLKKGREILDRIATGKLGLLDVQQVAVSGEQAQLGGYPTSSNSNCGGPKFRMTMKF